MATSDTTQIIALVIPAEGDAHLLRVTPDLPSLQALVGGYLEEVRLPYHGVLYCNEEGKFEGLPANRHATVLARHLNAGLAAGDIIVGDTLVVGTVSSAGAYDGDEHDVPDRIVEECRTIGIEVRGLDAPASS